MIFDTDVLIWFFRGNRKAASALDTVAAPAISIVTYMELVSGARDKSEMETIKDFLSNQGIQTIPLTENIGHRASIYVEQLSLSAGVAMADALIAATAVEHHLNLCTGNKKHFRKIPNLQIKTFKP